MHRSNDVRLCALCSAVVLFILHGAVAHAADVVTDHHNPLKHLVLDSRVIKSAEGLQLVQGSVQKEPKNPLMLADKPWENALNNLYPNVAYDRDQGMFKLWYKCVLNDKDVIARMMPPTTVHDQGWFLLYATSKDGVNWDRPSLGTVGFDGSKENNITARDTPNAGVLLDPRDRDASRRYKMIYDVGPGEMRVRFSADGTRWSEPITPKGLGKVGDTHNNVFVDPATGEYVLITRMYLGERLVYRSTSKDFLNWTTPTLALRSTPEEAKTRQTYCMGSFPYGSGYIGLVMMYNATTDRTVDCELAWSEDAVTWRRPFPGKPLIPRGLAGSFDAGCIYAQANSPVIKDGELQIYYGGSTAVHRGWKRHCLLSLATLSADRFAGYTPEKPDQPGVLLTKALRATDQPIRISADAKEGSIVVTVLDSTGQTIATSEPLAGELTDVAVKWKSSADVAGKEITLRFELKKATLFAFSGVRVH